MGGEVNKKEGCRARFTSFEGTPGANDPAISAMVTRHAEGRLNRWSIDINKLFEALLYPEEVLTGHYGRFIAHKRYGTHIVRAVYEYDNDLPVVVTAYYPLVTRYFKGGGTYADKILP